ncbi:isoprenylcysteine carboxylmethyltransferase family protein [Methyloceanibacter sp. wino2]|uniref:methyltransferase family protein n=1 Tax=Methyloceanibacter sp. wino2 TaxID=2170729 RepID=UPI000D3E81B4|nr:isoprenylcysteine carboxylmethyltransferase family protein [Methyloceanibacter sp. wino2]
MRTKDYADVAIKPPILFLGALLLGYVLTLWFPIGPGLAQPNGLGLTVGLVFVVVGFVLAVFPARRFRKAGTSVVPGEPSTVLVKEGAYKVTRNPIYIGLILIYFGLCLVLTSIWMLLLLVPTAIVLHLGVVKREEDYLSWKFGDAYRSYMNQVPRWL